MFLRLSMPEDEDAITEMGRANMVETCPELTFSEEKCRATIRRAIETASPTIWVIEHQRRVIAFLLADMYEYEAAEGFFTVQRVLYVTPAHRGSRAALLLMKHFVAWSERLGAKEIIGGNDNSFNSERTAKFLEHFGFERVGFNMRRVLRDG
jgi:L-amino acid N-acyltransferase YncA